MRRFREDDERDLESELNDVETAMDGMAGDFRGYEERRRYLKTQIEKKQMDPVVKKALELAQNAGHALGANEALGNRIKLLERRIEVRDEELDRTADRDSWKARAEEAEATIARSKKRKSRR